MGVIINAGGGGGGNVRYNPDTDMVEAKYNGVWTPFYNAGLQTPVSLVPVLTASDSRVLCNTSDSSHPGWLSFDENSATGTSFDQNVYVGFDFQRDVYVNSFYVQSTSGGAGGTRIVKMQYSDDNVTWYDASAQVNCSSGTSERTGDSTITTPHRYWRLYEVSGNGYCNTLRFYGRGA